MGMWTTIVFIWLWSWREKSSAPPLAKRFKLFDNVSNKIMKWSIVYHDLKETLKMYELIKLMIYPYTFCDYGIVILKG